MLLAIVVDDEVDRGGARPCTVSSAWTRSVCSSSSCLGMMQSGPLDPALADEILGSVQISFHGRKHGDDVVHFLGGDDADDGHEGGARSGG